MLRATALLLSKGHHVREIFTPDAGIRSSIANRLCELRTAFSDPSISAIICTTGGPSFTELLPGLLADTELHRLVRANPKIVVGNSDTTGLHWFLHAVARLGTFYGPGAIPELCGPRAVDDADYEASPLAFCVKHLFRAIAETILGWLQSTWGEGAPVPSWSSPILLILAWAQCMLHVWHATSGLG